MFTAVTQSQYQRANGREYIWSAGDDTPPLYLLTGAVLGSEIIRVRFLRGTHVDEARYQLTSGSDGTLPYHSWIVAKGDERWPTFGSESERRNVLAPYLQGFAYSEQELRLTRPLASKERIYGLGERTGPMNKRGQAFPIWNIDPPRFHTAATVTMYTSIPFYIGFSVDEGRAYGILIDTTGRVDVDMGKTHEAEASITVQGDSLVVYFFTGPTAADVMRQYAELTGYMPLPARWTLGYHQSRWGYISQTQVEAIATRLRERNHPCDAIWLDIDYMDGFRNFTWNPETFPDPALMTQKLHEQGIHLITILDPGTKVDEEYLVYQQGIQHDYFCRYQSGKLFTGKVWPGECAFPDFSRSEVRAWWGSLYQKLLDQGVDGIWNDMNEPSLARISLPAEQVEATTQAPVHVNTMANDVLHHAGRDKPTGSDGPPVLHKFFHNAYGMEMARSTYEGLVRLRPNSRPFVLTRSGTAGMQRYAALWTGDNTSSWGHLSLAISMCLNISMSGVSFVGVDIGGFWHACSDELLVRFAQLGAFLPFCRNHNSVGNPDQEPWAFGEPHESAFRKAIETRYRLMPYLYTLFHEASTNGTPIMRPLYYHYPRDEQACDSETEFLIGDAVLSAPIYEQGATSRSVYLPEGIWFDYWDGTEYPGNTTGEIPAPLDRWPLLIRANSILPTGPVMQYVDQRPTDPLTFTCFMATDGLASYTLYEDDGSTQAYRSGAYATTAMSCRVESDLITVRIDEQHNGYQPQRKAYEVIVHVGSQVLRQMVKAGQGTAMVRF